MTTAFSGWRPAAADFYRGLEVDNSKAYFTAHRPVYDEEVVAPMRALLAELEPAYGAGKIYRPNRDIRFSADKSPYKIEVAAHLGERLFIRLDADELMVGAGLYLMSPSQLTAYRAAVDAPASGGSLTAAVDAVHAAGLDLASHDALATVPRGFARDHPRAELLRRKGLAATIGWPVDEPWVATPGALDRIIGGFEASRPLLEWLDEHVPTS